jgi:hypothetical protein
VASQLEPRAQSAQERLRFLSLPFALRRAVNAVDLARIREILTAAAQCGLIDHPLFIQALELLERASVS